jgi:hypothetical protein
MALCAIALYGWGWAFRKIFGMAAGTWAVTLALGLASVIFLGGILNAARLAYPAALMFLVFAGLVLALGAWHSRFRSWSAFSGELREAVSARQWYLLAIGAPILLILVFVIATALPPAAYNTIDDYGKYFFHPVRMLAYGTLYGSSLSDLGSETLGGKAFLDGFIASLFPLKYLNASDAVFGLFLCFVLAAGLAGVKASRIAALLAVLAVFVIDPQWINISATYLGAALIMSAVALSADPKEMEEGISTAALGAVYAALIAMKTSFALFVVLHAAATVLALSFHTRSLLKGLRFATLTAFFSLLFLSPWIILYAPHYLTAHPASLLDFGYGPPDMVGFLSLSPLVYGSTAAQYTLLMAGALIAAIIPLSLRIGGLSAAMIAAAGVAGFAAYVIMFAMFGPLLSGYAEAVRYSVPISIGIVPAMCALLAYHIAQAGKPLGNFAKSLPWLLGAWPILLFFPSVFVRLGEAFDGGVTPAFPFARTQTYAGLDRDATSDAMRRKVEMLQGLIPEGASVTVWMGAPFFLDLNRNPVAEIDSAGLATPWARLPQTSYVIWEYGGYARPLVRGGDVAHSAVVGAHERLIAGQEWAYSNELAHLAVHGTLLYKDARFAVFAPPP